MPKHVKLQTKKAGTEIYFVTVPKGYVEALGWKKGDKLTVEVIDYKDRKAILLYRP